MEFLTALSDWLRPDWPPWLVVVVGLALFVIMAGLSLVVTAWAVVRLPADYFRGPHAPPFWPNKPQAWRVCGRVGKNLLGAVLVVVGIMLSLPGIPGQGLLTVLLGLMLIDLPGRRRLEQWLVRRASILRVINRLRARYGRPPLQVDEE